jgi:hypothetical protein
MVQFLNLPQKKASTSTRFAEAINKVAGQDIPEYFMQQKQLQQQKQELEEEDEIFEELGIKTRGIKDPEARKEVIKTGLESIQKQKLFEQQINAKRDQQDIDSEADQENFATIQENFGDKFAKIWQAAPQGARTELVKSALEAIGRGYDLNQLLEDSAQKRLSPKSIQDQKNGLVDNGEDQFEDKMSPIAENHQTTPEKEILNRLRASLKSQDEGLLPNEKIARGKERYASGSKVYLEASDKLKALKDDQDRYHILSKLEESKKLPKNLGRLNIDNEGNLRFPYGSTPEAERFVKTLNEFSASAKNTFGARVTNFDLAQYMKRYPSLLNSAEGRRQILQQLKIVNEINSVYYKNLKKVYDKAGGARNIDSDVAQRFAEELSENSVGKLRTKFDEIGLFPTLPSASEFKDKKIRDEKTGEILISDGENWVPQG